MRLKCLCLCFVLWFLCLGSSVVKSQLLQQEVYDYCDPKLKLCEVFTDHTMCKYPVAGLSPKCIPSVPEPLSATEKKRILFWHNKFRSNVANGAEKNKNRKLPTSSNMRQIYWDEELETIAARWAEQCTTTTNAFPYDKCRNTKRFQVSQNVGTRRVNGTTIDKQAPQIVISWYKDSKDFDPALVDAFAPVGGDKIAVKQFANIIWGETYAIGCARVIFQEQLLSDTDTQFSTWTTERLVCNYGPGGNEIGKPVYKRGTSCESCPSGTQCSRVFPGLCAITNAEKLEGHQSLEVQEPKDDVKGEHEMKQEIPGRDSPGAEEESEETMTSPPGSSTVETILEEEERVEGEEEEEEKEIEEREDECEGDECHRRSPSHERTSPMSPIQRFDEIINKQRPTARKKSRGLGDDESGKRKWIDSKVKRNKPRYESMRDGDTCKCYEELVDEDGGSPLMDPNIFFIFFLSIFISFFQYNQ